MDLNCYLKFSTFSGAPCSGPLHRCATDSVSVGRIECLTHFREMHSTADASKFLIDQTEENEMTETRTETATEADNRPTWPVGTFLQNQDGFLAVVYKIENAGDAGSWMYGDQRRFTLIFEDGLKVPKIYTKTSTDSTELTEVTPETVPAEMYSHLLKAGLRLEDTVLELRKGETDVEALKQKIVAVAAEMALEHGWCSEVDRALENMGIDPTVDVRVTGTFTATATVRISELKDISADDIDHDSLSLDVDESVIENY